VSSIAFKNIQTLVTNDYANEKNILGELNNATVIVVDGIIAEITDGSTTGVDQEIDCSGKTLLPGFIDSHSHLIFAGDRAEEFLARSKGERYSAGGIRSTVAATRAASDEFLESNAQRLLNEALGSGTTTMEIKSGYGLTAKDELRSLRIAERFTDEVTNLSAHVIPPEFVANPDEYIDLIIASIIPQFRTKWIDVFCDEGAFNIEQAERILRSGIEHGAQARIHANQLSATSAIPLAVSLNAASVDHLAKSTKADIELLASSDTVATLLPAAEFSTEIESGLGRRFLDAGVNVAIATDCNPGSSYTTSMPFCIATAVNLLGFTVEEAVRAATLGGAQALRRDDIGEISIGKTADFVLLESPSYIHLAYRPGINLVHSTYKSGSEVTTWQK
jgi:imidazolonepropionase